MNENLYASPPPVEEEFVLDEITRRNSKSLRITAWGLMVASVGMTMNLLVNPVVKNFLGIQYWEWTWFFVFGFEIIYLGIAMCLVCRKEVVPQGRYLIIGILITYVLTISDIVLFRWQDAVLFVGFILWGIFLWLLARTMKIRHVRFWICLMNTLWICCATAIFILRFQQMQMNAGTITWRLNLEPLCSKLVIASFVASIVSMLLLRHGILRGLRGQGDY